MYQLVAQVRTQQWITMIREISGNEIPEFVEIHQPDHPSAENTKNIITTAVIQSGRNSTGIPRMLNCIREKTFMYAFQKQNCLIDDYMVKYVAEHEFING